MMRARLEDVQQVFAVFGCDACCRCIGAGGVIVDLLNREINEVAENNRADWSHRYVLRVVVYRRHALDIGDDRAQIVVAQVVIIL